MGTKYQGSRSNKAALLSKVAGPESKSRSQKPSPRGKGEALPPGWGPRMASLGLDEDKRQALRLLRKGSCVQGPVNQNGLGLAQGYRGCGDAVEAPGWYGQPTLPPARASRHTRLSVVSSDLTSCRMYLDRGLGEWGTGHQDGTVIVAAAAELSQLSTAEQLACSPMSTGLSSSGWLLSAEALPLAGNRCWEALQRLLVPCTWLCAG